MFKINTMDDFNKRYITKTETYINGYVKSTGFTMDDHINVPNGFKEVEEWCEYPYRVVWINDELKTTITYCEGDISVRQSETKEAYAKEIAEATAFYTEE